MADVLMLLTMVGFILVCVAYVGWCDRLIRTDDPLPAGRSVDRVDDEVAA